MPLGLQPAWDCEPQFGVLCAGLGVLSADDVALARDSGLRVFVYREMPKSFHQQLFVRSQPAEVKSGKMCDFMRKPCTPPDAPHDNPSYNMALNEWLTGAKHCADVPLLTKLLALGQLPGVYTSDPAEAHLFVVPFLGGFIERVSPGMTQALDRDQRNSKGIADDLFRHLHHHDNATAARHLFLLTNSCGGCLRTPCYRCATWQVPRNNFPGMTLAATLGPSWPLDAIPARAKPAAGRRWLTQLVIPPNIMEEEVHAPRYVPLCGFGRGRHLRPLDRAGRGNAPAGGARTPGGAPRCRPNTAHKELLLFYQGAHSFNGIRDAILGELRHAVFFDPKSATAAVRGAVAGPGHSSGGRLLSMGEEADADAEENARRLGTGDACDCRTRHECCVNRSSGVAFFHTRSHWHPVTPLGFGATVEWMQRSRFCVCPPGDVPYNKRYFTALLAGCVPVLFSFRSQVPSERNWWKPRKGPGQRSIDPFYEQINHTALGIVLPAETEADIRGFIERLRAIPDAVVEAKQRAIERVRHLLLYDMSGSREDAFTCMLRQLIKGLRGLPAEDGARRAPLQLPDQRLPFGPLPRQRRSA